MKILKALVILASPIILSAFLLITFKISWNDPSTWSFNRTTPLHAAAGPLDLEKVKALLQSGADVNVKNDELKTPLYLAAEAGVTYHSPYHIRPEDLDVPRFRAGLARNRPVDGFVAGELKISTGQLDVVSPEVLLADLNTLLDSPVLWREAAPFMSKSMNSGVLTEIRRGEIDKLKKIFSWRFINRIVLAELYGGAFDKGLRRRQEAVVRALLGKGADVNAKCGIFRPWFWIPVILSVWPGPNPHDTALHAASRHGREDIVKILLESHADPHAKTSRELTPLHEAASAGVATALLERGADPNSRDRKMLTPLMYALGGGIVERLIEKGADVNAEAESGETALSLAATYNREDVVEILLRHGARIRTEKRDILKMVRGWGGDDHKGVIALLEKYDSRPR